MTSTVFVMPVFLFMIFVVVQMALAWHAKTMIEAAASDALTATQVDGGSEQAGVDTANTLLAGSTNHLLTELEVSVERRPQTTDVVVRARVTNVVPLVPIYVNASASGPTERFRPAGEGGDR